MPTTYTEREVAQIIERAVVRQEAARRRDSEAGLSLDDLERLGREVGIDPEHLRAAAAEVDAGAAERSSHATATHLHVERWTSGPLDTDAWEDAVEDLRQRLGTDHGAMYGRKDSGRVVEAGATRTWEHTSGLGVHTRLVVSERGARTRIRLAQQVGSASPPVEAALLGVLSMLLLGPLAGGVGAALVGGVAGLVVSLLLGLVLLAGSSLAIYRADVAWREKKRHQLEDLADELATKLATREPVATETSETEASEVGGSEPGGPRLDLDGLDAEVPATASRTGRRVRS